MVVSFMGSWEYATSKIGICTSGHARQLPRFRILIRWVLMSLLTIEDWNLSYLGYFSLEIKRHTVQEQRCKSH
jgi:hypothetical protein